MINKDRIVPVTKTDLLSLYGTMLTLAGNEVDILKAQTVNGLFTATEDGIFIANQPVRKMRIGGAISDGTVYFVAAYGYEGFEGQFGTIRTSGDTVDPNANLLYEAKIASGAVTITAVTPTIDGTTSGGDDPIISGGGGSNPNVQ